MTTLARFAASCFLAVSTISVAEAAAANNAAPPPVIIERAPEPGQIDPGEELVALRSENQRLSRELTRTREVLDRLRADEAASTAARAKNDTAADSSTAELPALRAKLAETEAAAAKKSAAEDEIWKKLEANQKAIDELTARNQQLESTVAARTNELGQAQAALNEAARRTAQAAAPQSVASANDAQLAAEKARADEAVTRLNTIVTGVDNLTAEKGALEGQLAEARKTIDALREQWATAQQAAPASPQPGSADAVAKLADAESRLAAATRSLSLVQAENDLLKAASADNARLNGELQTLRQQKASFDTESPELNAKIADLDGKLSTTLRSYSLLQAENDQLKKTAAEMEALREQNASLQQQLAAATAPATEAESAASKETADRLATVLRSYSQLQAENDQLKQAAAMQEQQSTELADLRQQNAALQAQLATATAAPAPGASPASAETEDRLATVLRSYSQLQDENDRLKAEAASSAASAEASASRAAAQSASQLSALFDELRQTKASITALSTENAQLKTRLALVGSPPGNGLSSPSRPGSAAATAAMTPAIPLPAAPAERTHVVAPGDTLGRIARQYYGSSARWEDILRANAETLKDPNALPIGSTLRIP